MLEVEVKAEEKRGRSERVTRHTEREDKGKGKLEQ